MSTEIQIIQNGQFWYVVSSQGRSGPMDSEQEAHHYANLIRLASAAGSETACTEEDCLA